MEKIVGFYPSVLELARKRPLFSQCFVGEPGENSCCSSFCHVCSVHILESIVGTTVQGRISQLARAALCHMKNDRILT